MLELFLTGAFALGLSLAILWIISIARGEVSFIDAFWGSGFVIAAFAAACQVMPLGPNQRLALILLMLWGLRLSVYLLRRYLAAGEDRRYQKILGAREGAGRHLFSLWFVFGLQGVLILVIGLPITALLAEAPRALDAWSYAGATLWAVGAFFEWVGDWQLHRFKSNPANDGKVLCSGLWAWTRHPNYFGDACVWWGLWLIGHDPWFIFAPALMTLLLMKWSGVPLLERSLKKRRPDYVTYIERTSGFFPRPPKRGPTEN